MNFACWTSGAWAAGSWVEGSWCPGDAPAAGGGTLPRHATTRTVDLFAKPVYNDPLRRKRITEDEEILIL